MLKPEHVFTPAKLPIEEGNVYAKRGKAELDFSQALARGQVPIVFGEYGVGKTSLARKQLVEFERNGKLVNIENASDKTIRGVLERVLETLGYTVDKSTTVTDKSVRGETLTGTTESNFAILKGILTGQKSKSNESQKAKVQELVVTSPSDSLVLDLCEQEGIALLIDELHKATPQFVKDLSTLIKAYANKNCKAFKLVLLGTASDASRLVDIDPGISRHIIEVELQSMNQEESKYVIDEGMRILKISMDDIVLHKTLIATAGSPSLVQFIGLEMAEAAFPRAPRVVSRVDLDAGLDKYVRLNGNRLKAQYMKAIETVGEKRYRKQILVAMSSIDEGYVTMDRLREQVSLQMNSPIPASTLSGPLRKLKNAEFGKILKDVNRYEGGPRVNNFTTFSDPAMKAFIRILQFAPDE